MGTGFIGRKFLDQLKHYSLHKDSAPWS